MYYSFMGKLKNALFSLKASGSLGGLLTFLRRRGVDIVEATPSPIDPQTAPQLAWRHMFNKCVDLWHALSAAEKLAWESDARPHHMTGYAWYISQCLRPNPGIYLPLQGGTMAGDIDMAKHRLLKLPLPVDSQEPLTLAYFLANISPFLYYEGARVYHSLDQSIPHATRTTLAFDSERYDTDTIHDIVTNNSRLTCKTAGKYVISTMVTFAGNVVGFRNVEIRLNGTTLIAVFSNYAPGATGMPLNVTTQYHLAVGNYVETTIYQTSGGALDVIKEANYSNEFAMQRIGT